MTGELEPPPLWRECRYREKDMTRNNIYNTFPISNQFFSMKFKTWMSRNNVKCAMSNHKYHLGENVWYCGTHDVIDDRSTCAAPVINFLPLLHPFSAPAPVYYGAMCPARLLPYSYDDTIAAAVADDHTGSRARVRVRAQTRTHIPIHVIAFFLFFIHFYLVAYDKLTKRYLYTYF